MYLLVLLGLMLSGGSSMAVDGAHKVEVAPGATLVWEGSGSR